MKAGDRVGIDQPGVVFRLTWRGNLNGQVAGFQGPLGESEAGSEINFGPFSNYALLLNADIEPDADCDGLGDETQDATLGSCGGHPPPPDTTPPGDFARRSLPADPTNSSSAAVSFHGTDANPGPYTFECSRDGTITWSSVHLTQRRRRERRTEQIRRPRDRRGRQH